MANPRVQKTLRTKVEAVAKEFECQPSSAFIIYCLQNIWGLDEFESESAITDGGNDKGIDAIFNQTDENGNRILYIIQSKFFDNPDKQLDETAKSLMIETIRNYVLEDAPSEVLNQKLRPRIDDARELRQSGEIDRVKIVFLTNGQRPQPQLYDDLDRFCNSQQQVDYEIYTESEITDLILPASSKPIGKLSLRVSKDIGSGDRTFLSMPDINHSKGKVVRVDVYEIAKLVENYPHIFNANVRGFLGKNNVNKQILNTLSDKSTIESFIYLNNGITIICDSYQIKPGNEVVDMLNPSIINGCQTASTILEAYKLGRLEQNTGLVLVRIIESTSQQLKESIIRASNTQSVVKNRDLISEDAVQKELEAQFETLGYFYQRKRGMFLDESKDKVVDLERAAQAYMAMYLELPAEAKNKKAEIYDDYYRTIFDSHISAISLLASWKLLGMFTAKLKREKKNISSEQFGLYSNATLHLLPLFNRWVLIPEGLIIQDIATIENSLPKLQKLFDDHSSRILSKLSGIMASIKMDAEFTNYQYFFKSSSSLQKLLSSPKGEVDYQIELNLNNHKRNKDLRYTKPQEYSLDGKTFTKCESWQDLFVLLLNKYSQKFALTEGNLDFIDSGSRLLVASKVEDEEKKLRKQLDNKLWLLTNFDSKRLSNFCFSVAEEIGIPLIIKIRPTKFRLMNNL